MIINLLEVILHHINCGGGVTYKDLKRDPAIRAGDVRKQELEDMVNELLKQGKILQKGDEYWPVSKAEYDRAWALVEANMHSQLGNTANPNMIDWLKRGRNWI